MNYNIFMGAPYLFYFLFFLLDNFQTHKYTIGKGQLWKKLNTSL
jgi:hypothetical protein